jgi:peptidoglycan/LPS O-acetylase OafA/YrhL
MSQRTQAKNTQKRGWLTYLWIFGITILVSLLIYFERTALLYVLATLGVTALLLIIAFADLGGDEPSATASVPGAKASNLAAK